MPFSVSALANDRLAANPLAISLDVGPEFDEFIDEFHYIMNFSESLMFCRSPGLNCKKSILSIAAADHIPPLAVSVINWHACCKLSGEPLEEAARRNQQ